jgi:hypothetical protein
MSKYASLEIFASDGGKVHWSDKFAYDCLLEAGVDESTALKTMQGVKEAKKVPVSKEVSKDLDPAIAKMQETKAKYAAIRKKYGKEWKDSEACLKELEDAGWKVPKTATKSSKRSEYDAIRSEYGDKWRDSSECIDKLKTAGWKEPSKPKSDDEKLAEAEAKLAVLKAKKAASDDEKSASEDEKPELEPEKPELEPEKPELEPEKPELEPEKPKEKKEKPKEKPKKKKVKKPIEDESDDEI